MSLQLSNKQQKIVVRLIVFPLPMAGLNQITHLQVYKKITHCRKYGKTYFYNSFVDYGLESSKESRLTTNAVVSRRASKCAKKLIKFSLSCTLFNYRPCQVDIIPNVAYTPSCLAVSSRQSYLNIFPRISDLIQTS